MSQTRVLVLGVGNILMRDEGFGVRAVEYLQEHYTWGSNIRLLEGGTLGMSLMPEIIECDKLIVLDAVLCGEEAGTFCVLEGDDLRKSLGFRDSTHQTDLVDILIFCELTDQRPETLVYGMQPYDWQTFMAELTPEAQAQIPAFCAKVVADLQAQGFVVQPNAL